MKTSRMESAPGRYQYLPWEEDTRFGLGAEKAAFFIYPFLGDHEALRLPAKGTLPPEVPAARGGK